MLAAGRGVSGTKERPAPATRADYRWFVSMPTRWMDNDVYGHVNNVAYYSFFDTAVARFLLANGVLDLRASTVVGLVVDTACRFAAPIAFPDEVVCGLRCGRLGSSSIRYEIGIFRNDEDRAAADESTRVATTWVRERLHHLIKTAPVISMGDVVAMADSPVGR